MQALTRNSRKHKKCEFLASVGENSSPTCYTKVRALPPGKQGQIPSGFIQTLIGIGMSQ